MEEKLTGIVLSRVNYGENDYILNVFTLEKGTVSARIKGVKKAGAKLKFASEPFCFAQFIFSVTQNKRTVIGASLIDSFFPLRENLTKYYCGATILEFIKRFAKEEIVSKEVFLIAIDSLKKLAYENLDAKSVTAYFLINALRQAGYGLTITEDCVLCSSDISSKPYFDYRQGAFFCQSCSNEKYREINPSTLKAINQIVSGRCVEEKDSTSVLRLLDYYLANKTEEKLNSLKELLRF